MKIVVVGETNPGSRTPQRLRALTQLGHQVAAVSTTPPGWTYETPPTLLTRVLHRLRLPADPAGANHGLVEAATRGCDLVLLEAAKMIRPATLRAVRRAAPDAPLVWYSEDDTLNPAHRSRWLEGCIPLFDLWVTTKSFNAQPAEVPALGARRVLFVNNSFDPADHAPIAVDETERRIWGADVAFVGTYERPRAADLLALAEAGIAVRVWGNGWAGMAGIHPKLRIENRPVYGDDYRRVVASSAVNLCFLRKGNRDLQTCRSVEIPAMGGFMLHEASAEVEYMFAADREAVYFRSRDELIGQCRIWLADSAARQAVATAARHRAVAGGHSHADRWRMILGVASEEA